MFQDEGYIISPLLSVSEAAKYLGVGRRIVYQLIERGELRVVKAGGAVRIEVDSLEKFMAGKRLT